MWECYNKNTESRQSTVGITSHLSRDGKWAYTSDYTNGPTSNYVERTRERDNIVWHTQKVCLRCFVADPTSCIFPGRLKCSTRRGMDGNISMVLKMSCLLSNVHSIGWCRQKQLENCQSPSVKFNDSWTRTTFDHGNEVQKTCKTKKHQINTHIRRQVRSLTPSQRASVKYMTWKSRNFDILFHPLLRFLGPGSCLFFGVWAVVGGVWKGEVCVQGVCVGITFCEAEKSKVPEMGLPRPRRFWAVFPVF